MSPSVIRESHIAPGGCNNQARRYQVSVKSTVPFNTLELTQALALKILTSTTPSKFSFSVSSNSLPAKFNQSAASLKNVKVGPRAGFLSTFERSMFCAFFGNDNVESLTIWNNDIDVLFFKDVEIFF